MSRNLQALVDFRNKVESWGTVGKQPLRATMDLLDRICVVETKSDHGIGLPHSEAIARAALETFASAFRNTETPVRVWTTRKKVEETALSLPPLGAKGSLPTDSSWTQEYKALARLCVVTSDDDPHKSALLVWAYEVLLHLDRVDRKVSEPKYPEWPECGVSFYIEEKIGAASVQRALVGYLRLMPLPFAGPLLVESFYLHKHCPEDDMRAAVRHAANAAGFFTRKNAYAWWIDLIDEGSRSVRHFGAELAGDSLGGAAGVLFTLLGACPRNCIISTTCDEDGVLGRVGMAHDKADAVLNAHERGRKSRPRVTRFVLSNAQGLSPEELRDLRVEVPKNDTLKDLVELVHAETRALNAWCDHLISLPNDKKGLPAYYRFEGRPEATRTRAELFQKPTLRELVEPPPRLSTQRSEAGNESPAGGIQDGMPPGLLDEGTARLSFDELVRELSDTGNKAEPHHVIAAPSGHGKSLTAMMLAREIARVAKASTTDAGICSAVIPIPLRLGSVQPGDSVVAMLDSAISQEFVPGLPRALGIPHQDELLNRLGKAVDDGRAVFFLDGLDENGTDHGCAVIAKLLELTPKPRIVVLTRYYGLSAKLFDTLQEKMKPLDDEGRRALVTRCWRLEHLTRDQAEKVMGIYFGGKLMVNGVAALNNMKGRLSLVRGSGLLLTFALHLVSKGEEFNKDSTLAQLYARIIELVVEEVRNDQASDFEPKDLAQLLPELAFEPFLLDPRSNILRSEDMLNAIAPGYERRPSAAKRDLRRALKHLCDSGLIYPVVTPGGNPSSEVVLYAFAHRSFLEYLAARRFADVLSAGKCWDMDVNVRVRLRIDNTIYYESPMIEQATESGLVSVRKLVFNMLPLHEGTRDMLRSLAEIMQEVVPRGILKSLYNEWDEHVKRLFFYSHGLSLFDTLESSYFDLHRISQGEYFLKWALFVSASSRRTAIQLILDNSSSLIRRVVAARAVAPIAGEHEDIRETLLAVLRDETVDSFLRRLIAGNITLLAVEQDDIRETLLALLQDEATDLDLRGSIASAIAPLAGQQECIRQAVLAALRDKTVSFFQRGWIVKAIVPLAGKYQGIREGILAALRDFSNESNLRSTIAQAIAIHAREYEEIRQELLTALRDKLNDSHVRASIVQAIAPLATELDDIRHTILGILQDKKNDSGVHHAIVQAIAGLAGGHYHIREAMLEALRDKNHDPSLRSSIAEAIVPLAGKHKSIRDAVLATLQDKTITFHRRSWIMAGAAPLSGEHEDIRKAVIEVLLDRSNDSDLRGAVAGAIAPLAGEHQDIRRAIFQLLRDRSDSPFMRAWIMEVIQPLVSEHQIIREAVFATLRDETINFRRRGWIMEALASLASDHEDFRECLLAVLRDGSNDFDVRASIARAIAPLAGKNEGIRKAALAASRDGSIDIQRRGWITVAMAPLAAEHEDIGEAVLGVLRDRANDPHLRASVARAIAPFAGERDDFREEVFAVLKDETIDSDLRGNIVASLANLASQSELIFTRLLQVSITCPGIFVIEFLLRASPQNWLRLLGENAKMQT